jgi:hypothetical protein
MGWLRSAHATTAAAASAPGPVWTDEQERLQLRITQDGTGGLYAAAAVVE